MSGSHRHGRFRAVGSINAVAIMGGDEIDLREAEIEGGELTLNVFTLMGGATIFRVPPQARGLDLKQARRLAKAAGRGQLPAAPD